MFYLICLICMYVLRNYHLGCTQTILKTQMPLVNTEQNIDITSYKRRQLQMEGVPCGISSSSSSFVQSASAESDESSGDCINTRIQTTTKPPMQEFDERFDESPDTGNSGNEFLGTTIAENPHSYGQTFQHRLWTTRKKFLGETKRGGD